MHSTQSQKLKIPLQSVFRGMLVVSLHLLLFPIGGLCQTNLSDAPNIILIVADDQGWGDLSVHGNQNLHTPNIDALAANGARFQYFYVSPVCSPTRAELLTGRYHPRSGVSSTSAGGERMDLDEITLADVFKAAGYATAAFGKWHNGMQYPYHPNGRGFDEFYGFCSGHWGSYFSPMLEHNGRLVQGKGFMPDDLTNRAMAYMEAHQHQPFLVYMAYNTPHSPMQVSDSLWNRFRNKALSMRHRDPAKEDIQFTKAALALCENIDWNVGRLMQKLQALDLKENTIVLYLSDNGPNSWRWNGGMKGRKGATDEGGVRSPLFIQWPKRIAAGREISQIAGAIDLLPTLTDLADIRYTTQNALDGLSLKPLLLEKNAPWQNRMLFHYWNGSTSARSQQYRLDDKGHLYDIEQDPGQTKNIASQKPGVTEQMIEAVDQWQKDVLSELSTEDQRPFPLGHPGATYTQLPARDGIGYGHIQRSNQYPNCSYFTNWTSLEDEITWNVDVLAEGDFEVTLYYTCPKKDVGSRIALTLGKSSIVAQVTEAHDPPLQGKAYDRVERVQSYVKDFKPMKLGVMHLEKGVGRLKLKALTIPGSQVMDFRLLMFTKVNP